LNKKLQRKYLQKQIRKKKRKLIAKHKRNNARRDRSRFFFRGSTIIVIWCCT